MPSASICTPLWGWALLACSVSMTQAGILQRGNAVAWAGTPFGVGRVTLAVPAGPSDAGLDREAFDLHERNGRVHYPVFSTGPLIRLVRNLLGRDNYRPGDTVQIWFLFTGSEPLEIQLKAFQSQSLRVVPQQAAGPYRQELQRWWDAYIHHARHRVEVSDYPPLVELYLTHMLGRRLGLPVPDLIHAPRLTTSQGALSLLLAPEALHMETVERILGQPTRIPEEGPIPEGELLPLPPPIVWDSTPVNLEVARHGADGAPQPGTEPNVPTKDAAVAWEPMANHVPQECFYIRFGSFENFRWFRRTLERHGGDLARVVTLRAHDQGSHERMEDQLALKEGALAAILGGQVISDVALIGRDLFLQEGAAIGVLFETRLPLLAQDIQRQRLAALERWKALGGTQTQVELAGKSVSFLATPDNRLRSYYVQDGRYHLVTNSRSIAERFLQAGQKQRSLAETPEFQAMRRVHPPDSADTAWVYLSRHFLEALFAPEYQIELQRRMIALAEIELQQLATYVARVEGMPQHDLAALKRAQLLPQHFGARPDRSMVAQGEGVAPGEGEWSDSLRGKRGTFIPIPDVEMLGVSASERQQFEAMAAELGKIWQRLDPVMVAVQRQASADQPGEELRLKIRMLPFQRRKFMPWVDLLGAPATVAVRPPDRDLLFAEIILKPDRQGTAESGQHLFLGVQDAPPARDVPQGMILLALRMFREIPGYVGAWPEPGWLERLPWVRRARTDIEGIAQLPSGLYRHQAPDGTTLVSFHRDVLQSMIGQTALDHDVVPAQFRFRVGNLADSALKSWTQSQEFERASRASHGNAHLMHTLSQQFAIPREEAPDAVQKLLNVRLICPLHGNYELRTSHSGLTYWASTAWDRPMSEYQPPLLGWFRGAEGYLTVLGEHVDGEFRLRIEERSSASAPRAENSPQPPAAPAGPPDDPLGQVPDQG